MKTMKKVLALVLTLSLVLTLGLTAFAAEGDPVTYKITIPEGDNHTYVAYQVLKADVAVVNGESVLSNIQWGANAKEEPGMTAEAFVNSFKNEDGTPNEYLTEAQIRTMVLNVVDFGTTDTPKTPKYDNLTKGDTVVEPGYYIIKDKNLVSGDDTGTLYIIEVAGNITITRKTEKPSSEKKVWDKNDSTGTEEGWMDSADHDIGDNVKFKLEATVADDFDEYVGPYKLTFHDVESTGLEFNSDVQVYVDDSTTPIDNTDNTYYTVTNGTESEGEICTFEVHFANLKNVPGVTAGSVIRVEYTSKLTEGAIIGSEGNPNKMKITYSNNPYDDQGGENGETPWDKVIVFTYKTVWEKIDGSNNKPLAGADFTLYKKVTEGATGATTVDGLEGYWCAVTNKSVDKVEYSEENEEGNQVTKTAAGAKFTFKGLDDGTYAIVEIVTPSGYNTMEPMTFSISAEHEDNKDNPQLISLTTGDKVSGEVAIKEEYKTVNTVDGKEVVTVNNKIENNKGTILPSTGGIGTTLFYVVGSILMLAAVVLLISRKKMSAYQD